MCVYLFANVGSGLDEHVCEWRHNCFQYLDDATFDSRLIPWNGGVASRKRNQKSTQRKFNLKTPKYVCR